MKSGAREGATAEGQQRESEAESLLSAEPTTWLHRP